VKYAFMTFSCPDRDLAAVLALAQEYGYDGFEARIDAQHAHGIEAGASPAERAELRRQIEQSPVALACVATSCRYANVETREANISDTLLRIDLAAALGCDRLRVFGGMLSEGLERPRAVELVAEALRRVADRAAQRGVTVCMETHDAWCDPAHVAEVMRKVDHPNVGVNWDIMHPVRAAGVTMEQAHAAVGPWVRHVHFHDGMNRDGKMTLLPIGEGIVDHRKALELLAGDGYDGYWSGEWIKWQAPEEHLGRELAAMKQYESELGLA